MTTQIQQAQVLHDLHVKGNPLVLVNIWDAGSAAVIEHTGAKVIATGSWSVATAHGYEDGQAFPFTDVIENLKQIKQKVQLPITIDIEGGYGHTPEQVFQSVQMIIEAGAVGINIEDQIIGEQRLYSVEEQCARIVAARQAADQLDIPLFINARTDIFLQADPLSSASVQKEHADHALTRAKAYAHAGANGFFVPGLSDPTCIQMLCTHSPLPINIMLTTDAPSVSELSTWGVSRISYGPSPYQQVMNTLQQIGQDALSS